MIETKEQKKKGSPYAGLKDLPEAFPPLGCDLSGHILLLYARIIGMKMKI